jgi:hypothetical protein
MSRRIRAVVTVAAAIMVSLVSTGPAMAYAPVGIVHTEHVQAGPYDVTLGFSTWPIRAMQSLDFTFVPAGGIAGKSGSLRMDGPGIEDEQRRTPLVRHPRKLDSWGLDVQSLNAPGAYTFGFAVDGPLGRGEGTLPGLTVLAQPGPPMALSWLVGSLPFVGLIAFFAIAWRRTRPGRRSLAL